MVAAVGLDIAYRETTESIGRQQYNLLTSAATHLQAELISKRARLQMVAEEMSSQGIPPAASMQQVLTRHPSLRDSFFNVVVLDARGYIQADLSKPADIGRGPFADRPYLADTLRAGQGIISQPIVSQLSGKPVVLMTQPIRDAKGNIVAVIAGGINLADPAFFGQISRLGSGASGYLFALTREGLILHHPDATRLARNVNTEPGGIVSSTRDAVNGWEGWTYGKNKRGVPSILTYKQMREPGWVLGAVFPASEAFAGITKARDYAWISAAAIALLAGLFGWSAIRRLLQPLQDLRRHVHEVEHNGASIKVLDVAGDDEVGALGRAFHSLSVKRELAEQRLRLLSQTDALTGLSNRRQFDCEIALAAAEAADTGHGMAIGFLDIDHFKTINDCHGHAAGDAVLKEFAARLCEVLRPTDHPYRFAGDEFVIVLERVDSAESLRRLADKVLEAIRVPFGFEGQQLFVTTSIGIALSRPPLVAIGDLLQHADAALYKTKRAGRDGVTVKELVSDPG